jgi:hypothetical protein
MTEIIRQYKHETEEAARAASSSIGHVLWTVFTTELNYKTNHQIRPKYMSKNIFNVYTYTET